MTKWTQADADRELDDLIAFVQSVAGTFPFSTEHTRWVFRTRAFLEEVFGQESVYFRSFIGIRWEYVGPMAVHFREVFDPSLTKLRHDMPVFANALEQALGLLMAAKDQLTLKGIDGVYEGKNTAPEASLLLRVIKLSEQKLRKVLRTQPKREKEVQDAFENLLIGAEIP
jgi:hypothetical protein